MNNNTANDDEEFDQSIVEMEEKKKQQLSKADAPVGWGICEPLLRKLQKCYATNGAMYGCEKYLEDFESCRSTLLGEINKKNAEEEYRQFRKKFIKDLREKKNQQHPS